MLGGTRELTSWLTDDVLDLLSHYDCIYSKGDLIRVKLGKWYDVDLIDMSSLTTRSDVSRKNAKLNYDVPMTRLYALSTEHSGVTQYGSSFEL